MVKVGEVEFLVKFDSINTEFKKVLEQALKDVGVGTGGDGDDALKKEDLMRKVDSINSYLSAIATPTGKRDDYRTFLEKYKMNYKKFFKDEVKLEELKDAIRGNAAVLRKLGVQDIGDIDTEKLEKLIDDEAKLMFNLLREKMELAVGSEAAHQRLKPQIGKAYSNLLKMLESDDVLASYMSFMQSLIDEAKHVTLPFTKILDDIGIDYKVKKGAEGHGEKFFKVMYPRGRKIESEKDVIGIDDEDLDVVKTADKLQELLISNAEALGLKFTDKDIEALFVENKLGPNKEGYKAILEKLLEGERLQWGGFIPDDLSKILEEIFGRESRGIGYKSGRLGTGTGGVIQTIEELQMYMMQYAKDIDADFTEEDVKALFFENKPGGGKEAYKDIIEKLLTEKQIGWGTLAPDVIIEILEDMAGYRLQYSKNKDGSTSQELFKGVFPGQNTENIRYRRGMDAVMEFTEDKLDDLITLYEKLTGEQSMQLNRIKDAFTNSNLDIFIGILESKAMEAKLNEASDYTLSIGGIGGLSSAISMRMAQASKIEEGKETYTNEEVTKRINDSLVKMFAGISDNIVAFGETLPAAVVGELKKMQKIIDNVLTEGAEL